MAVGYNVKRRIAGLLLLVTVVSASSCGLRNEPESVPVTEEEAGSVPVAEFHDMKLPGALDFFWRYAYSENWLFCADRKREPEAVKRNLWLIYKNGINDPFEPVICFEREGGLPLILLADRDDNCFLFCQDDNGEFSLEKYDADGEMQWHAGYDASAMQGIGESLGEGIVTADGRVFLYTCGEESKVFAFGADGELQGIHTPDIETLEGVAEGSDGQVYGYCITGETSVFVKLDEQEQRYVCPVVPLKVYGGREDGIYLCTGEGMWRYDPVSAKKEWMWAWDDEYVQIDGAHIEYVFRGKEKVRLLCMERHSDTWGMGDVLTFVSVGSKERRDYPARQVVTISNALNYIITSRMEDMARRYNRQNRKYRVVVLLPEEDTSRDEFLGALKLQLIRGEGPDLIGILGLDVSSLAAQGAFEDLSEYYETVDGEEILESVRKAGQVMGKDMIVIPSFSLETMQCREAIAPQDWTPRRFLELTQANGATFENPVSQREAFWYCMGARTTDDYIDYDKRECFFDREEFRLILEGCNGWKQEEVSEYTFRTVFFNGTGAFLGLNGRKISWVGYPSWEGAQIRMWPTDAFAMNSASTNKEGAWDFLAYLLSEEMQDSIDWEFPVRKDSLEKYFATSYVDPDADNNDFTYFSGHRRPTQEDFDLMREMANCAVYQDSVGPRNIGSNPIRAILDEETEMYFSGDATLDETVDKIQNRVKMYLNEL